MAASPAPVSAATPSWQVASAGLPSISRLRDVTAAGPSAAWAVGYQNQNYYPAPGDELKQLYAVTRWNGATWTQQRLPGDPAELSGVSASSAADVWTVGKDRQLRPYAARFDGSAWTEVHPLVADSGTVLSDVAAADGKAVFVGGTGTSEPAIVEWDGSRFTGRAVTVADSWGSELYSVAALPGGAAFAVGYKYRADGTGPFPMVLGRQGGTWRVAAVPVIPNATLLTVAARSATDVWAVGTIDDSYTRTPLILHFDGQSWRQVAAPVPAGTLSAVAADAAGTVWITGTEDSGRTLYLRHQSGRWTVEYGVPVNSTYGTGHPAFSGLTAIPGARGGFWGAGGVHDAVQGDIAVIGRRG
ncbi:hypothetical protein BJY16_003965 [Actinoplanes octamycinicus]|uniref:Uncharacterized protein n=1 Tax=Actinoplanes octamycinicus TaxID=135948 RepID=A0A7W7M874_9ACTN|nr:hypothetical protein [Actinoplanes octamycinicus]MBB4740506.1 hypothetical protein [Actinoplanes octamycinicus]GIE59767.1 hypothetical protein Aoc01nite_51690 [Actinoplanes octamycinicus]